MQAVRIHAYGGPEVMRAEDVPVPEPGPSEVLVRMDASGVNFIDIYQRSGAYQVPLPRTLGTEGAGTVEAVGRDVSSAQVGDRVGWAMTGATYAQYSLVPADRLIPLPDGLDGRLAAAALLQGMTAHYLTHDTFPLKPGDTCLLHAAAGGAGLLVTQMAKMRGARVIGTVSTEAKAQLAHEAGADEVILYTQQDFEVEVKRLTDRRGVDVVYDSVGKDTFERSLRCLRPRGYLVLFGQSSGAVPPLDPQALNTHGSLFLTRPSLGHYVATRDELLRRGGGVLGWVASGALKVRIDREFPLTEAAAAHQALASRGTAGKLLLVP